MRRLSHWGLLGCLTLEWLALGLWVGGMVVLIGAVIPAVFNTFGGQDSGGMFLTRAFDGYHRFVIGAMAVLCVSGVYRWWSGEAAAAVGRGEVVILALMVVIAGVVILVLHPQAAALQSQAFATQEEAAKKAAFESLFRMLLPIRVLDMVNLALGVLLIGMKTKRSLRQEGSVQ